MRSLGSIDAAFLKLETPRTPMHVGALLTFKLPADAPPHYLRELFADMRKDTVTMHPFNAKLAVNKRARLMPAWVEADDLDIDYHLRHSALPYPGGERELGVLVARLQSHPMDMHRPLWECHLIEGLENGRFAIYLKAHHAALDGMGALKLVRRWLSEDPAFDNVGGPWALPETEVHEEDEHEGTRPWGQLLRDTRDRAGGQLRSASELVQALRRMSRRRDNPEGGILSALATPRSVFNASITPHRRLATQLFDLARVKAISAATGTTVNDVSLALVGAAIRRYLIELGALPPVPLIASIPVGLPRPDGKQGNAVAGFVCPLATEQDDLLKRLQLIHAVTSRTKEQLRTLSPDALEQFTLLGLSPLILGQMTGLATKLKPFFNVIVSNVLGAKNKLHFRGAELEALYPVSVLFDGYALNITLVGYADKLSLGFTGCRQAVPHVQRLAVYTGEALTELEQALKKARKKPAGKPRQAKKK